MFLGLLWGGLEKLYMKLQNLVLPSSSEESSESESDGRNVSPLLGSAGSGTPVAPLLQSYANLPTVNLFDQAQSFAQAKADAQLAVTKAQERLAALQANALVYQTQVSSKAQSSGPPLKTNDRTVVCCFSS